MPFQPPTGLVPRSPRIPAALGAVLSRALASRLSEARSKRLPMVLVGSIAALAVGAAPSPGTPVASPTRGLCERTTSPSPTTSGNVDSYSAEGWPVIAGKVLRLHGIETLPPAQVAAMKGWVENHNNYLECQAVGADSYQCQTLRRLDLACIVLFNGGARASPDAEQSYRDAEQQAREERRGIWK